ncbi:MAG: 2-hydroxychromene-2-carboxylate isomerase [Burkholderiaceae bacterium]|nr:2-hydroxychromene-2-carboxylate isomerase [Burkholderiaceae bacterium]
MTTPVPPTATGNAPEIEFWFDFGSNYSYLSAMRIEAAAADAGCRVRWRPFVLGAIFRSFGWATSPFVLQERKGAYVWKDMERQCRKAGIAWARPSVFPRSAMLPHRVALLCAEEPWIGAFCRHVMQMNFVEDRDFDDAEAVIEAFTAVGVAEPGSIIERALSDANKSRLREQTNEAAARGIFGAPTFFVGTEMFWGNDRLNDALACTREASRC